jgi:hypothetical protein
VARRLRDSVTTPPARSCSHDPDGGRGRLDHRSSAPLSVRRWAVASGIEAKTWSASCSAELACRRLVGLGVGPLPRPLAAASRARWAIVCACFESGDFCWWERY